MTDMAHMAVAFQQDVIHFPSNGAVVNVLHRDLHVLHRDLHVLHRDLHLQL